MADLTLQVNEALRLMALGFLDGTISVQAAGTQPVSGSVAVSSVTPGTGATNLAKAAGAAYGGSGDVGVAAFGHRNDNAATTRMVTDGFYGPIALDLKGVQFVKDKPTTTATISTPTLSAATSGSILALNASRRGATIYNNTGADLFVKLGTAASQTSFTTKLVAGAYYEVPFFYTGIIHGFATLAPGASTILVTEITD